MIKFYTVILFIMLSISFNFKDEYVVLQKISLETPNSMPMELVRRINKKYHGEFVATFRKGRWYFKNPKGQWCKLIKYVNLSGPEEKYRRSEK